MKLLVALALIAVCGAAGTLSYYFGYLLPRERDKQTVNETKVKEDTRVLDGSRRCMEDGMKFFAGYSRGNADPKALWDAPEFHFSRKLNTCLVATRYILPVYPKFGDHYNEIRDIYSNTVILYGHFSRDSSVEPSKEELLMTLDDTPNYTSGGYLAGKAKLFSE